MIQLKVIAFARFQAILTALVGLLLGILYSFGGFVIDLLVTLGWISSAAASTIGLGSGTILAFGALIGMPVILAAAGFILGLIEALLFNRVARRFKGSQINKLPDFLKKE